MTQPDTFTEDGYIVYAVVIGFLFVIGITGQVLCLAVLMKKEHRQREMSSYLVNIAIANTMLITINFPVVFASSVAGHYVLDQVGCQVLGFNAGLTGVVMVVTLACITANIHRQVTSTNINNRLNNVFPQNSSWIKLIVGIWVYSFLIMLPTVFGLGSITLEAGNTHCAPEWRSRRTKDVIYLVFLTFTAFVVPITVTCVSLTKINRFLAKCQREIRTLSRQQRRHYEQYKTAATMMGVATIVYFLAWTPYCVFSLIAMFNQSFVFQGTVSIIPGLFAKSSVIYNPILYTLINRRFRNSLLSLISIRFRKSSLTDQVQPGISRQVSAAWYDRRQGTSSRLVPRSPITGRSKSSPLVVTYAPEPSNQLKSAGVSPRFKPSIRFLLRPSFLSLKMLRPQLSDEGPGPSANDVRPGYLDEGEEENNKSSKVKVQTSF